MTLSEVDFLNSRTQDKRWSALFVSAILFAISSKRQLCLCDKRVRRMTWRWISRWKFIVSSLRWSKCAQFSDAIYSALLGHWPRSLV